MNAAMKQKVFDKIPEVVTQMVQYYDPDNARNILLTVKSYTSSGVLCSQDHYYMDEDDMLSDLYRAKYSSHATISVSDTVVTVTVRYRSGGYAIATYEPLTGSD